MAIPMANLRQRRGWSSRVRRPAGIMASVARSCRNGQSRDSGTELALNEELSAMALSCEKSMLSCSILTLPRERCSNSHGKQS